MLIRLKKRLVRYLKKDSIKDLPPIEQIQMRLDFEDANWNIRNTALPDGFTEKIYDPGIEQHWLKVLNSSDEFGTWNREKLSKRILSALVAGGGILLYKKNEPISSAALCNYGADKSIALLMYIVVTKKYRGLGLGKYMVGRLLEIAEASGYSGVVLKTESNRISALSLYTSFGFSIDQYGERK